MKKRRTVVNFELETNTACKIRELVAKGFNKLKAIVACFKTASFNYLVKTDLFILFIFGTIMILVMYNLSLPFPFTSCDF